MNNNELFELYDREYLSVIFEKRDAWFKTYLNIDLVKFQKEMSDAIITHFLDEDWWRVFWKSSRQTWKSTVILWTIIFIWTFLKEILPQYDNWKNMNIWFSVPKLEQAYQNFFEIKNILKKLKEDGIIEKPEKDNMDKIVLSNWTTFYIFSLAEGTSNQSKTLALSIADEAQDINYEKYRKEIEPMLATTNWTQVFIWVGSYIDNTFYRVVNWKYKFPVQNVFINDYHRAIKERQELFELNWNKNLLKYKVFCEWLDKTTQSWKTEFLLIDEVTKWSFISLEALQSLKEEYFPSFLPSKDEITYIGIDWAKSSDSTVITIINQNFKILNIFVMQGHLIDQEDFIVWTLIQYKPKLIFSDETWLGAGSTAYLQRIFGKNKVIGITFTTNSKHDMYSNLINYISQVRYSSLFDQEIITWFETQFSKLLKSYTSTWKLKVNHPDWWHDDYPDSLALACLWTIFNKAPNTIYDLEKKQDEYMEFLEMSTESYSNLNEVYFS